MSGYTGEIHYDNPADMPRIDNSPEAVKIRRINSLMDSNQYKAAAKLIDESHPYAIVSRCLEGAVRNMRQNPQITAQVIDILAPFSRNTDEHLGGYIRLFEIALWMEDATTAIVLNALIANKFDYRYDNDRLLFDVCKKQYPKSFECLLKAGVDVRMQDDRCIKMAVEMNNIPLVKICLNYGANIDVKNGMLLLTACENRKYDMIKFLINNGADKQYIDDFKKRMINADNYFKVLELLN